MMNILAADIGATSSRFAHFSAAEDGSLSLVQSEWIETKSVSSFPELIEKLQKSDFSLRADDADIAVLAVAGPVERGTYSAPPYISWDIDLEQSAPQLGIKKALLLNDFAAQAYACRSPVGQRAESIIPGERVVGEGTIAVIGAGSNLGKAMLVKNPDGGYIAVSSEGGHVDFPVIGQRELEFQQFVLKELGVCYITCNHIVSGKGVSFVHQFLTGEDVDPEEVTKDWNSLSESATAPETLVWAARFYGRVCRNFALETLAYGGLYISGGVAAKNPVLVRHQAFRSEFHSSPKHGELLRKIPVLLMMDEESGLWGSGFCGLQQLGIKT